MKNKFKILLLCCASSLVFSAQPVTKSPKIPTPLPKTVKPVMPIPGTPAPIEQKKAVAPKAQSAESKDQQAAIALPQDIGTIAVENTSKHQASWTGWKIKYKTVDGSVHHKLHTLNPAHKLIKGKTATIYNYSVHNLPPQALVEGVTHIFINKREIPVNYKGSPWVPGTMHKFYVTSSNGSDWVLDTKAMNADYKKMSKGSLKSTKKSLDADDSIAKVTDTTKAAVVPMVLQDKKNKKKLKSLERDVEKKPKNSKSSKSFDRAQGSALKIA